MGFWLKHVHSARWIVPGARFLLEPLIFVRKISSLELTGFRTLRTYVCRKRKLFTGENRFRFSKSHTYTGALYKIRKNIYTGAWYKFQSLFFILYGTFEQTVQSYFHIFIPRYFQQRHRLFLGLFKYIYKVFCRTTFQYLYGRFVHFFVQSARINI